MTKSVLVVDDSPTIRSMICAAIEDHLGWEVEESSDGVEALRALGSASFDLVVTDINMPQLNGLELLKYIRSNEAYDAMPVLIVTTEGQARDRQKGLALGANNYLVKPLDPDELVETLRTLVGE